MNLHDNDEARWHLCDSRTGERAGVASFLTQAQAERVIATVRRNVERGRRPDLAELLPFLIAVATA